VPPSQPAILLAGGAPDRGAAGLNDGFLQQTMQTMPSIPSPRSAKRPGGTRPDLAGPRALFAFGAYASALLTTRAGVAVWIAVFVAGGGAGFLGFLVAVPRCEHADTTWRCHHRPVVVTFVVPRPDRVTNGPTGLGNIPRPEWFGGATMARCASLDPSR